MCVIRGNAVIELSTLWIWFIYKYVDDKANIGKYKTMSRRGRDEGALILFILNRICFWTLQNLDLSWILFCVRASAK